jgi:hypothetical protein
LSEKDLGPLRQGQRLDTTEIKCSKIADSSRWVKRARHHRQKSPKTRAMARHNRDKMLQNCWLLKVRWKGSTPSAKEHN